MSKNSFKGRKDTFFVLFGVFFRNEMNIQNAIEFQKWNNFYQLASSPFQKYKIKKKKTKPKQIKLKNKKNPTKDMKDIFIFSLEK